MGVSRGWKGLPEFPQMSFPGRRAAGFLVVENLVRLWCKSAFFWFLQSALWWKAEGFGELILACLILFVFSFWLESQDRRCSCVVYPPGSFIFLHSAVIFFSFIVQISQSHLGCRSECVCVKVFVNFPSTHVCPLWFKCEAVGGWWSVRGFWQEDGGSWIELGLHLGQALTDDALGMQLAVFPHCWDVNSCSSG